jgi:primosomal protein N'
MSAWSRWLRMAAGSTALAALAWAQPAPAAPQDFMATRPSAEATRLVDWVMESGNAAGKPFAIVDKRAARLYVFHADGRLAGHTPALLGSTPGDHTVPGVGQRTQDGTLRDDERTTPAGRFEAQAGQNIKGEHVVWVDYESAFAIHRLRPGFAYQARASRLAAAKVPAMRVSWGCVVVPVAFYTQVVEQVLGQGRSVVYVMPEAAALQQVFHALDS